MSAKTRHGHPVLVAGSKFVYVHVNGKGRNVACTGSCLKSWPTVASAARPRVSSGVRSAHVARNAHHDVTYYGLRLYYFSFDVLGGSALGDHINSFGGSWRLINTAGKLS